MNVWTKVKGNNWKAKKSVNEIKLFKVEGHLSISHTVRLLLPTRIECPFNNVKFYTIIFWSLMYLIILLTKKNLIFTHIAMLHKQNGKKNCVFDLAYDFFILFFFFGCMIWLNLKDNNSTVYVYLFIYVSFGYGILNSMSSNVIWCDLEQLNENNRGKHLISLLVFTVYYRE